MTAEEVLSTMADSDEETQEVCVIDAETQTISVPACYSVLGVESDENTKRVYFRCPAVVGDNVNLLDYSLRINYQNGNKKKGIYLINDVSLNGDNIEFSWLLSRGVTAYKGKVNFIFCAVKADEITGLVTNEWNTTLATSTVLEGLEPDYQDGEEAKEDLISQLLLLVRQEIAKESTSWNDLTDKPFYTEERGFSVEILPETIATPTDDGEGTDTYFLLEIEPAPLVTGEQYEVTWNGEKYVSTVFELEDEGITFQFLGNIYTQSGGDLGESSTGEPFVIQMIPSDMVQQVGFYAMIFPLDGSTELTLSILGPGETIHYLDPKYIKDMYYSEGGMIEVYPETELKSAQLANPMGFVAGETYIITFGGKSGISFKMTAREEKIGDYDCISVGNTSNGGGTDTGDAFGIIDLSSEVASILGYGCVIHIEDASVFENVERTLSIFCSGEVVHKLPNKYLDLDWLPTATEGLVEIYPETTLTYNGSNAQIWESNHPVELVHGDTYVVTWNGVEYTCDTKRTSINESADFIYIGNGSINTMIAGGDTGEPFMIGNIVDVAEGIIGYTYIMADSTDAGDVTVAVSHIESVPNKLPKEYLPAKTVLYQKPGEYTEEGACYLYTDADCTTIVTDEELSNAINTGLIIRQDSSDSSQLYFPYRARLGSGGSVIVFFNPGNDSDDFMGCSSSSELEFE